jgi:Ca2+-transporting ATPase
MTACVLQIDKHRIEVSGSGYAREGIFTENGQELNPRENKNLLLALRIGALCNDARLNENSSAEEIFGDPTEVALLVVARKAGLIHSHLHHEYPRYHEIPFNSEAKRMATYHRTPEGDGIVAVKGAVSVLLDASSHALTDEGVVPLDDSRREQIRTWNTELASKALRVLALAFKQFGDPKQDVSINQGLTFIGLVGMLDPLRDEARAAVAKCRDAGIRVVMITGDQIATASEIGSQLGIMQDTHGTQLRTVHGRDVSAQLANASSQPLSDVAVFARVSPEHKLRIVEGFQAAGQVVAMTGDGVNDGPALKKADIGIAMGIKGSEVAKDASDMVITDDNFATIVYAIEQGRIIYANIIRFVHYLFSCNLSEIFVIFFALVIGWPLPLAAIQLLWLNMITDIFPALALVLEPSSPGMMQRPPRRPDEPILSRSLTGLITLHATVLCTATLIAFGLGLYSGATSDQDSQKLGMTMAFMTLAFSQILHALSSRSQHRSIFTQSLRSNYWLVGAIFLSIGLQLAAIYIWPLQRVLHTVALNSSQMLVVIGCSVMPAVIVELLKSLQKLIPADFSEMPRSKLHI